MRPSSHRRLLSRRIRRGRSRRYKLVFRFSNASNWCAAAISAACVRASSSRYRCAGTCTRVTACRMCIGLTIRSISAFCSLFVALRAACRAAFSCRQRSRSAAFAADAIKSCGTCVRRTLRLPCERSSAWLNYALANGKSDGSSILATSSNVCTWAPQGKYDDSVSVCTTPSITSSGKN